jgi:hypothetical protein
VRGLVVCAGPIPGQIRQIWTTSFPSQMNKSLVSHDCSSQVGAEDEDGQSHGS